MAHVVEGRGIFSSLTVEENLALVFRQRARRTSVSENLARAYEAFPILGERRKQAAGTLSGDSSACSRWPRCSWCHRSCSSPTSSRSGWHRSSSMRSTRVCEAINRNGTAMLVVEQQVDRVLKLASKALVLDQGRVAYDGDPAGAATVIDQLMSRREQAGSRAAALVVEGERVPMSGELVAEVAVADRSREERQ